MNLSSILQSSWRKANALTTLLLPFTLIYGVVVSLRRWSYRLGLIPSYRASVPVIVVGNLTVGGSGKTPLVIYLVEQLRAMGYHPGVISRGYGAKVNSQALRVTSATPVRESGDEPALIVRRTGVPLVIGANRRKSIELLLSRENCDLIISDDGLQHYSMQRDIDLCIVDLSVVGKNHFLLPAGPYRELPSRIKTMDIVVEHVVASDFDVSKKQVQMTLDAGIPQPLINQQSESRLSTDSTVHAVAGIAKPERFFATAEALGFQIKRHPFADHHDFQQSDILFDDDLTVLMTEKDAVKCRQIANQQHWYLPVSAKLNHNLNEKIARLLNTQRSD